MSSPERTGFVNPDFIDDSLREYDEALLISDNRFRMDFPEKSVVVEQIFLTAKKERKEFVRFIESLHESEKGETALGLRYCALPSQLTPEVILRYCLQSITLVLRTNIEDCPSGIIGFSNIGIFPEGQMAEIAVLIRPEYQAKAETVPKNKRIKYGTTLLAATECFMTEYFIQRGAIQKLIALVDKNNYPCRGFMRQQPGWKSCEEGEYRKEIQ